MLSSAIGGVASLALFIGIVSLCVFVAGEALAEAKQQTQGQLMLSLESPSARMYRLAGFSVHGEPYQSLDQVLAAVAGLTEEEMAGVAAEYFAPERQTVVWLGKA